MEATAVNPVLQSAIVDKYGKPFAEKTQQIVENLDMTVEKQDVVVEKQDQIGDKVKDVLSNLEGSGGNLGKAFGKSADGLKELTFGFVDIKGVLEEISKKFSAVGDLVAPLAEIGSFGFLTSSIGVNESGQVTVSDPDEKDDSPGIIDTSGNVIDTGDKKKSDKATEKSNKKTLNFMERFRKSIGFVITGFKNLMKSLIPLIAKFVFMGLKFAVVAFGVGKLIQALGGWNFVESFIDNVVIGLKSLQLAFLKATNLFGGEEKKKKIREVEGELRFQKAQKEDKKRVREIEEASKDEKGVINLDKVKEQVEKEGLVSSKHGTTTKKNEVTGAVTIMDSSGNVIHDPKIQQKLDYLAIKAKLELPKLKESVEKDGDNLKAKAALTAAEGFIAEYNRTYGDEKLDNVMGSYKKFQDEQGRFQDKSLETFLVTQDEGGMRENLDKYNPMGGRGDMDFATFVYGSKKIGDTIKKEIDETKSSDFIDSKGEGGYLARISAPNIATQINNAYQLDALPVSKESIADSS